MAQDIDINTLLEMMDGGTPVIDVRSPSEFLKASVPGAVSIPLFDDDERAAIQRMMSKDDQEEAEQLRRELQESFGRR